MCAEGIWVLRCWRKGGSRFWRMNIFARFAAFLANSATFFSTSACVYSSFCPSGSWPAKCTKLNRTKQNFLRNSQRAAVAVRCPFLCTQLTIDTAYFFWQRVEDLSPHVNICAPARSTIRRHLHYGLPHSPSKFHLRDSWKHVLHFQDLNIASGPSAFIFELNNPWHRVILGSFFIMSPRCVSSVGIA